MTYQELRQKCEELYDGLIMGWACHGDKVRNVKLVESFAREIRNDALEEACACFPDEHEHIPGYFVVEKIRVLKESQ